MIITRTPYRVSLFGGGTDYPEWIAEHGGAVIGTSIDKYCYITVRRLPPFFEHKSRIVYSQTELVNAVEEIRHPAVRETLLFLGIHDGVELHHVGDLPARAGIGSSSSFVVGLLRALYGLKGLEVERARLASEAIHIERNLIGDCVGCQDQTHAAHGGFNHIVFRPDGSTAVESVDMSEERRELLSQHLMLFFTGFSRTASCIARDQVDRIKQRTKELSAMQEVVTEGLSLLESDGDLLDVGRLLHEQWLLKRSLSPRVSTLQADAIYEAAFQAGAVGGKLLGAGGGGFFLLFVPPERQAAVRERLAELLLVPFQFEFLGSHVLLDGVVDEGRDAPRDLIGERQGFRVSANEEECHGAVPANCEVVREALVASRSSSQLRSS